MGKAWRIVLTVVVFLAVAGIVLMGAAWLTGASPARIAELVFGGPEELRAWWDNTLRSVQSVWDALTGFFETLF